MLGQQLEVDDWKFCNTKFKSNTELEEKKIIFTNSALNVNLFKLGSRKESQFAHENASDQVHTILELSESHLIILEC